MAHQDEQMNRRRRERELRRKKQLAQQRKLRQRLILAAAALLICGVAIFAINGSGGSAQPNTADPTPQATVAVEQPQATSRFQRDPTTVIHIKAAGDLNITDAVVAAGAGVNGYNFTDCFMDVAPILNDADLTVLNFEGNLCGEPFGTASASAPQQLAEALRLSGVDIVQMANSMSVNNGLIGLTSTLNNFRAAGLEPIGAFSSPKEFQKSKGYTICEVKGITVAFVAFTKGVGSMGLPAGNEDCVNLLYTDYATTYQQIDRDGIKRVLKNVASEKPDITIAMLHWGSELNDTVSKSQKDIVKLMQAQGVDVILGTHSHRVQQITYDEQTGNFVAYSLGDFFGDAKDSGTNYSLILDLEITRDNEDGTTRVTNFSYTPIYTLNESECDGQRRVVRIREAIKAYDENYVDKVTQTAYNNMKTALERIIARIKGPEAEKK